MGKMESYEVADGQRGECIFKATYVAYMTGYYLSQVLNGRRDRNGVVTELLTPPDSDWQVTVRETTDKGVVHDNTFTGSADEFNQPAVIGLILNHIAGRCANARPPGRR